MKYLLQRLTALVLAVLLLCSAGGQLAFADDYELPGPACSLGTDPSDMLAGGGRLVRTPGGDYCLREEDGAVVPAEQPNTVVLEGPVSRLNYADGTLYYAREREDCSFDLCAYDLSRRQERVLLESFYGRLGQLYLVDGAWLDFSSENAVWQLDLDSGSYRLVLYAEKLWSFVPTGCGLVYAVGELFDYSLYANGRLLAEHVDDYTLKLDRREPILVYTSEGEDYQMDLTAAFAGQIEPAAFRGFDSGYVPLSGTESGDPAAAEEAEVARIEQELASILNLPENRGGSAELPATAPDPASANPDDPQSPDPADAASRDGDPTEPIEEPTEPAPAEEPTEPAPAEEPTEPAPAEEPTEPAPAEEPTEPAPAEEPTEPAPAEEPTEPAPAEEPTEPAPEAEPTAPTVTEPPVSEPEVEIVDPPVWETPLFATEEPRRAATNGQQNIVRRARQMLNIRWTPRKGVGGWGYYDSNYNLRLYYSKGVTYTGLPYGQGMNYVPWNTSLSNFAAAVKDANSYMYTKRGTYGRGSQYYGTDCSGFVSWAWQTNTRKTCTSLRDWSNTIRIGTSYTAIRLGDAFISSYHTLLVTDVTYNNDGSIHSIELSQANPTASYNGCCYSTRYSGTTALLNMEKAYSKNGYYIYRNKAAASVSYTHDCAVPLEGDYCERCGAGISQGHDPYEGLYIKCGVDVSEHQGTINWSTAAKEIDFAILRVGYTGTQTATICKDAQFDANVAGCEANHIPYGIYFYAGATKPEQAREEANKVLEYITRNNRPNVPTLPIFYDVEENKNILKLNDTELLAVITAFCSTLEDCGINAGIYASTSVWNNRLTSSAYKHWHRWAAQWESAQLTAKKGASVWQYDSQGNVSGIATPVDMNYWLGEMGDTEHPATAVMVRPDCVNNGEITCTDIADGSSQSFPVPALGHLYANGVCSRCGEVLSYLSLYHDVRQDKWYSEAVEWALRSGLACGTAPNTFSPDASCTRAQILTFLWHLAGNPEPAIQDNPFTDVKSTKYYYKPVLWAVENGITSGVSATKFAPGKTCTRAQAVTFLWRYAGSPRPNSEANPFTDVKKSSYYYDAVQWAWQNGVAAGTAAGRFSPKKTSTRAAIVTMLYALERKAHVDPCQHSYQLSGEVASTCTVRGYSLYTCKLCGSHYRDHYKALAAHSYVKGETVAPTCTEGGSTSYVCKVCGYSYIDARTDPLGHDFRYTGRVVPTTTHGGYEVYTCSRCRATEERNPVDKLDCYLCQDGVGIFHMPGCAALANVPEAELTRSTDSREALIAAGFTPCPDCAP